MSEKKRTTAVPMLQRYATLRQAMQKQHRVIMQRPVDQPAIDKAFDELHVAAKAFGSAAKTKRKETA